MDFSKFNADSAPADVRAEPGELFSYEYDDEYNGICLLKYKGDKIQINRPENPELEDVQHLVVPGEIDGLPVVGVDYDCFGVAHYPPIYFPESIKYFKGGASKKATVFNHITISPGTKIINIGLFKNCIGLNSITIPESVTEIHDNAFFYCESLERINVDKKNPIYSDVEGVLLNKKKTVLIKCPMGKSGSVAIPHGVAKIDRDAFFQCIDIAEVQIPDSVQSIEDRAFYECTRLKSVKAPDGITEMGYSVFQKCRSLEEVRLPENLKKIPYCAFRDCGSLKKVNIPATVAEIGYSAFSNCTSLNGIILPEGLKKINGHAFAGCSTMTEIAIPKSVAEIGVGAFAGCKMLPRSAKIRVGKIRRKKYEKYSVSTKGKMDELTFKKLRVQPGKVGDDLIHSKAHYYAEPRINGIPYIAIMEPYLRECSEYYSYKRNRYVYESADSIYGEIVADTKGKKDIRLFYITVVYDIRLPTCVIVREKDDAVIWSAYSHYNDRWLYGELPVFSFDKSQYAEAIAQLKAIVDEQKMLTSHINQKETINEKGLKRIDITKLESVFCPQLNKEILEGYCYDTRMGFNINVLEEIGIDGEKAIGICKHCWETRFVKIGGKYYDRWV